MNKEPYFPQKSKWIFLFLLLVLSLIYNYHQIILRPPGIVHQWRQCDCLSLAANYYHFGMDFFSPAVYFASNDGTGKTASEFPAIYYFVAFLWKIFGKHEIIFRLVNLSIVYAGLFFLFRFIEEKLRDSFWAILIALLVFTSPILVYYSNGFIMDPLGLSFAFIAWYYFGKFYNSGKNAHLNLSLLFFLIGGLLKVSSMLSYFSILGVFLVEILGVNFKDNGKIFTDKKRQIIPFIVVAIGLYLWYSYAQRYNDEHGSGVFLVGIMPIWDYSAADIEKRITFFKGAMTLHQFFNFETLMLLFAFFFAQVILFKKTNGFLLFITVQLFFAVIAFLILWFGAVTEGHDYYLTNLLVFVAFALISFFAFMQKSFSSIFSAEWFKMIFALILAYNVYLASAKTSIRYFNTQERNYPTCYSKNEIALLQWAKFDFHQHTEQLREISPYLRSLGIQPNDLVISLPDYSFDISLYFMNQKGWTQASAPNPLTENWFEEK
ncbi:MAG: glycosyltransferase family 39 protein [Bacteroidetes bacterium]|nr:glycosyltransferase family 39 protein [Bacteroidota bacterium]